MAETQTWEQTVKIRQKKKMIVILSVTAAFILLVFGFFNAATYMRTSDFCENCHEMKPYHTTWMNSSHSSTECADCHFPAKQIEQNEPLSVTTKEYWNINIGSRKINVSDFMNKTKTFVGKSSKKYYAVEHQLKTFYYKAGSITQIIMMTAGGRDNSETITWQSCDTCHGKVSSAAAKNDDVGHSRHAAIGMKCKDCHGDLAHEGTKEMTTKDCKSCHADAFFMPSSHKTADFEKSHGQKYNKTQRCLLCHTKGTKEQLCMNCHGIEMPHPENFPQYHVQAIKQITIEKCKTCHEDIVSVKNSANSNDNPYLVVHKILETPEKKKTGNATSCSKCHGKNMPHEGGGKIIRSHGKLANQRGIQSCLNCHGQKLCNDCHGTTIPHSKGFLGQHVSEINRIGLEKCKQCHDLKKKNICFDCHKVVMPHPPGWKAEHGGDKAICTKCHSSQNPANPRAPWASNNYCKGCHYLKPHDNNHSKYMDKYDCYKCHNLVNCSRCHGGSPT